MRKLPLVLGTVFAVLAFQAPAFACRCTPPSEADAYARADAVAHVRVENATAPSADGTVTADVAVKEAWKRALPASIRVVTGDDCAYPFVAGREYILYLTAGNGGVFGTNRCQRNSEVSADAGESKWLRQNGRKF
jgi:hypothetical protein